MGIPPNGSSTFKVCFLVFLAFSSIRLTHDFLIVCTCFSKKHLGGFTVFDVNGVSPSVWKYMVETLGVHSLLDVGCGRGTSTTWFLKHGVDILCAEGSHDAYEKTFLPDPATQMVEHDFSRGPWWPEKTYDAVWAVEFLEHVNVQ
jgi:2-polyprenyl-3-methyl-5-hydroxy-6-metoxy-1,4-benzoquinol methylase